MSSIATGRIKIIDYNDALSLTGYINSNHTKNQTYDPDNNSYLPNWKTKNLILNMVLNKMGSSSNIITSPNVKTVKWFTDKSTTPITTDSIYSISGTKSETLTIKDNVMINVDSLVIRCEIVYMDNTSGLDLEYKTSIEFAKFINGSGVADAVAWAPNGNTFKNDEIDSLIAECNLIKNGVKQTENLTYQWYYFDNSVEADVGAGKGWVQINANTNPGLVGHNQSKLTIKSGIIEDNQTFKCLINDSTRATGSYFDSIVFATVNDPIRISITSTGGTIFKNNIGTTTLTARLFRCNEELDIAGNTYIYEWDKYNDDNEIDLSFKRTGKSINVDTSNVDISATFLVKVKKSIETTPIKAL